MVNRYFTVSYSYYVGQAKWALKIVGRIDEGEKLVKQHLYSNKKFLKLM